MDPIMTAVMLSWAEIKSTCEGILKHPQNAGETDLAEHVLNVMDRYTKEARREMSMTDKVLAEVTKEVMG